MCSFLDFLQGSSGALLYWSAYVIMLERRKIMNDYGPEDFERRLADMSRGESGRGREGYEGDGRYAPEAFDHIDPADMRALSESTKLEKAVFSDQTAADLAQSILEDAAPAAAMSIVHIATKDPNARVRLTAAQYIIDRSLGTKGATPAKNAPWEDVFSAVTTTHPAPNS